MTEMLLPTELLAPGPDDADWNDVLHRATRARRRRRVSVVAALAAAVAVGVASAYALGHPVIDFGQATKGSKEIVNDFGRLDVGAPPGMASGVLPHETRRITSVRIDGKKHVLWVAPTKQGGYCEQWSNLTGGCRADPLDQYANHIALSIMGAPNQTGVGVLAGSFFQDEAERVQVSYADGTSDQIPFVWVTEPINAGFFLYRVPNAHRSSAGRPTSVALYDDSGQVLELEPVSDLAGREPRGMRAAMHRLPGYPALAVPAKAEWSKRRQLFDLRADDGAHIGLWIAPERGGGTCFWTNQARGCTNIGHRVRGTLPPLALGFQAGGKHVTLCCHVGRNVARVEARFQDGARVELAPKLGYLLWVIPSRHYPRGHRLDELVAFDASGGRVASRRMQANGPGLYPCAKPKQYKYGVSMCP